MIVKMGYEMDLEMYLVISAMG